MITKEQVEHVAKLARLSLTEEEVELYTKQLSKILDYIDQLNEVDTSGVEPMTQPIPKINVMRDDVVKKQFQREEMLKNAPHEEYGFFRVPKIGE
jgi:aspartyl-tRNA(Asn)/glutamyl-tRNA(Gln) amidotransferase subunit C